MTEDQQTRRKMWTWLVPSGVVVAVLAGATLLFSPSSGEPVLSAAAGGPTPAPAPQIQPYARDLKGAVHGPLPTPEKYSHTVDVTGCDWDYGTGRECVPVNFPPGVALTPAGKCAWLKKEGFGPLEVRGVDTQKLAPAGGPRSAAGKPLICPVELGTK